MKNIIFVLTLSIGLYLASARPADAQLYSSAELDKNYDMILKNPGIQIEATEAINMMYNYRFTEADAEFRWLKYRYPTHPMPHFLMGLAEWWKIVPNTDNESHDKAFLAQMDSTIELAEELYDNEKNKIEPAFFLAAAYAFKGRLYAERESWAKAAFAGKKSLKYFEQCKGNGDLSPELLFGDGLYNYYAEWVPKEYPILKPVMALFPKGNKRLGEQQLEKVGNNAFYTRVEARYFLLQIYSMESEHSKAYEMAKYMWQTFPNNPYFERYFCRTAFVTGKMAEAEKAAQNILDKISQAMPGYEAVSGRNAAYVLAYYHMNYHRNYDLASQYYQKAISFSTETNSLNAGYYLSSLIGLGKIAEMKKDYDEAIRYYKLADDKADKKSSQAKEAKTAIANLKKLKREQRRKR
ncbi:tetratricopeptide repeat protein [Dyadobacter sandarakinus]|uniref:Tetratricopeptide repeat protein n=1 Tax=Dyadobacter sandarakinus TaxID=2747268 RepID=A0ABX7IAG0_9BACT|nr:tetratricopeptide repeat protein [Dyadobacter sandarakinus]QRR02924.1 tetratricopeptide repeat protein [Dyadobacter sandarakinus]